jgi:hypothetical protein
MEKSTISMAIFNKLLVYQRVPIKPAETYGLNIIFPSKTVTQRDLTITHRDLTSG